MTATAAPPLPAPAPPDPGAPPANLWLLKDLPRARLLPRSIRAGIELRRARQIALLLVVFALFLLFLLWMWAAGSVRAAQTRVDDEQAVKASLMAQSAKYSAVPVTKAALKASEARLQAAMVNDVKWSRLLADLAAMPSYGVVLSSMNSAFAPPAAGAAGGTYGTMTFSGTAPNMDALADWLDELAKQKWYANPFVSNTSRTAESPVVTWQGTAQLTEAVLTHDYDPKGS